MGRPPESSAPPAPVEALKNDSGCGKIQPMTNLIKVGLEDVVISRR